MENVRERLQENKDFEQKIVKLREQARDRIRRNIKRKKVSVSWSVGKDSIVLEHICRDLGIKKKFLVRCNLEYQQVVDWINENAQGKLGIVNTSQDLKWLPENKEMLFPRHAEIASIWSKQMQNEGQKKYFQKNNLDMILVGIIKKDGNDPGKDGMDIDEHGVVRYSPMYDWQHEDLLGYMEYFEID